MAEEETIMITMLKENSILRNVNPLFSKRIHAFLLCSIMAFPIDASLINVFLLAPCYLKLLIFNKKINILFFKIFKIQGFNVFFQQNQGFMVNLVFFPLFF